MLILLQIIATLIIVIGVAWGVYVAWLFFDAVRDIHRSGL